MRITRIESRFEHLALARPYTIASHTVSDVALGFVEIHGERGAVGRGSAAPDEWVTAETDADCRGALTSDALDWLVGRDVRTLPALARELARTMGSTPAARAAVDGALHDLLGQCLGLPTVELLGRAHASLPTSITIGIMSVEDALTETDEHLGRGFRALKVKLGRSVEEDIERVARIRERVGGAATIRVDPNQGYAVDDLRRFVATTADLDIELIEQPLPADASAAMRGLPPEIRHRLAADESVLGEADAFALAVPPAACGILNVKLMKCGGVWAGRRIADLAEIAGLDLMWGCMDESVVSIAAALHAALASPATRYLDLDGSFDLGRDVADGGFVLEDGCMRTVDAPGLGLSALD